MIKNEFMSIVNELHCFLTSRLQIFTNYYGYILICAWWLLCAWNSELHQMLRNKCIFIISVIFYTVQRFFTFKTFSGKLCILDAIMTVFQLIYSSAFIRCTIYEKMVTKMCSLVGQSISAVLDVVAKPFYHQCTQVSPISK